MTIDTARELARCDAEIAAMLARPGQPAWLVALGVNDWEYEKKLILEEIRRVNPLSCPATGAGRCSVTSPR